jgi:hypothetical protein
MYKVLWPYVTIKVRTTRVRCCASSTRARRFPDNADPDDVERLLRKGAIVDESAP